MISRGVDYSWYVRFAKSSSKAAVPFVIGYSFNAAVKLAHRCHFS